MRVQEFTKRSPGRKPRTMFRIEIVEGRFHGEYWSREEAEIEMFKFRREHREELREIFTERLRDLSQAGKIDPYGRRIRA
jgi:hypothetical protein